MRTKLAIPVFAFALFVLQSQSALACGGLVAPNGAIRLSRATTLVSWHNGIEHYMTSFTYQGNVSSLGWIVPLPAEPLSIEEGGAWTLQRLFRETHPTPTPTFSSEKALSASAPEDVEVLQKAKVQALYITVIKGSGQAVLKWANENGFFLDNATRDHIVVYSMGSPIFMAAKFDTAAAKERKQIQGDGTPLLITMKTPYLWVPLEILALEDQQANADLYLLTDTPINIHDLDAKVGQSSVGREVPGATGLRVAYQEKLSPALYRDLSTDRNMGWVRENSWLTYLSLDAPQKAIHYDLGVSPSGIIRLAPYGTKPVAVVESQQARELPTWLPTLPPGTLKGAIIALDITCIVAVLGWVIRSRVKRRNMNTSN